MELSCTAGPHRPGMYVNACEQCELENGGDELSDVELKSMKCLVKAGFTFLC